MGSSVESFRERKAGKAHEKLKDIQGISLGGEEGRLHTLSVVWFHYPENVTARDH